MLVLGSCSARKKARSRKVNTIIQTARSYTGTPYRWGGTTRAGMDCSGLLVNSFQAGGIKLPRTSHEQAKLGKKVGMKELQKGDLVFFATGKKRRKITHVGMVTGKKGKDRIMFIHSSSSLGVVETNIYSSYFKKRFRYGRRVI
ncbi:hypothetical protein PEPS_21120 [Persicobacter psychrovividus]|uniref:NlpC/P60 domain-containing protein n=1 Tax=Persicobacter psychrovividus TaxID=387638 RepID=A0ABM7VFX0_9BACT|nr:hypothetical protein PEPS_21120 [Persicobacter psychrovividus]